MPPSPESQQTYFLQTAAGTSGPHTLPELRQLVASAAADSTAVYRPVGSNAWVAIGDLLPHPNQSFGQPYPQAESTVRRRGALPFWLTIAAVFIAELVLSLNRLPRWPSDPTVLVVLFAQAVGGTSAPLVVVGGLFALIAKLTRRSFSSFAGLAAILVVVFYLLMLRGRSVEGQRSQKDAAAPTRSLSSTVGFKSEVRSFANCDFTATFFAPTTEVTVDYVGGTLISYQTVGHTMPYCRAECIPSQEVTREQLRSLLRAFAHKAGMEAPEIAISSDASGLVGTYQSIYRSDGYEGRIFGRVLVGPASLIHLIVSEPLTPSLSATAMAFLASPRRVR